MHPFATNEVGCKVSGPIRPVETIRLVARGLLVLRNYGTPHIRKSPLITAAGGAALLQQLSDDTGRRVRFPLAHERGTPSWRATWRCRRRRPASAWPYALQIHPPQK
jgi:hypothetical protein